MGCGGCGHRYAPIPRGPQIVPPQRVKTSPFVRGIYHPPRPTAPQPSSVVTPESTKK